MVWTFGLVYLAALCQGGLLCFVAKSFKKNLLTDVQKKMDFLRIQISISFASLQNKHTVHSLQICRDFPC